tara:strand:- start:255 stop:1457 length:1203 start_codon:yes stop_codon:yes gene_type:complete
MNNNNLIKCPHCHKEFSIGDSLKEHENELRKKIDVENEKKYKSIKLSLENDANKKAQEIANKKIADEKNRLQAEATKKAKILSDKEFNEKKRQLQKDHEKNMKLIKVEKDNIHQKNKKFLDLEKEKMKEKLDSRLESERLKVQEEHAKKIKSLEIDNTRLKKSAIENARKAEQGAVEHQGEVQEEVLEDFLRKYFQSDGFEPVKKGAKGADIVQSVIKNNEIIGKILWESKDAASYNKNWEDKLLKDMAANNSLFGVIVTEVMPKESQGLVQVKANGKIFVCPMSWATIHSIALILRPLVDSQFRKEKNNGNANKQKEALYSLIRSPKFKHMVQQLMNEFQSEYDLLEKDEKMNERSLSIRRKNLENKKKFVYTMITQIAIESDIKDLFLIDENNDEVIH